MLFFKFPFAEDIFTTDGNSAQNAVSFISFDQSENIGFRGNIVKVSKKDFINTVIFTDDLAQNLPTFKEETQAEYEQQLRGVITYVRQNRLPKLVISRRKLFPFASRRVNLGQTFLNLAETYPNAFVYVFIKDKKCWIGAFSELLGRYDRATSRFETMALAGTLPLDEVWTQKEIAEQQPVADYIFGILQKHASDVAVSETRDHVSGNIKHLRTDYRAKIQPDDLENIIAQLHPTPAVCGIPKDLCREAIAKFEKHPRHFYAGYIKVETAETVHYFVNLRCAEIFSDAALLYVGGGITADSDPAKEWRETELKAEAILKNISFT